MSEKIDAKPKSFLFVVAALSLAQFIMTVDTTIMNVSVPTLVQDLDTTVSLVQLAIALYALIMASFMLIGGKLGEIHGRKKIFQIGLVVYGVGSLVTAIAPNILVLIFGWSILEGIGASLMMPAMMSLISINFQGKYRASALGITAGVAGAAAALGPIIGGALSSYASWRYAFIAEVLIAITTLFMSRAIGDSSEVVKEKLDLRGAVLVASGLSIFVLGIMQAGTYGWIRSSQPFSIGDIDIEPFGLSIVPFICGLSFLILWYFFSYEKNLYSKDKPVLLKTKLLEIVPLKSGLNIILITQLTLGGVMFVLPLFLQLVLGFSAIKSGLALFPLSIGLITASIMSAKLSSKFAPYQLIRFGQLLMSAGLISLALVVSSDTQIGWLIGPFLLVGGGIGLILPLNQLTILGSVENKDSSQASGLNFTFQQLGMSLGTAVIGTVLLFSLGNGIVTGLSTSDKFEKALVEPKSTKISSNVEFVSDEQLKAALKQSEFTEDQQKDILKINAEARVRAIRIALVTALVIGVFGFIASSRLKDEVKRKELATNQ